MNTPEALTFTLPEDGWFHIATPGEWPHKPTGLVQVLDDEAMQAIVDSFTQHSSQPNWPGVLIDFDHQSLDQDKPTTAAGWIIALEKRPTGIWAKIRWSDLGQKSIEGGRYRFISPVWRSTDCALLGDERIRPLKLMNCAVTNDPNIKGLFPLSNTATEVPLRFAPPGLPLAEPRLRLRPPAVDRFRSALANRTEVGRRALPDFVRMAHQPRRPLTDEQRKAIFAKQGGGGYGGGGTASPSAASAPPRYARDHEARIDSLTKERDALIYAMPAAPEKRTYDLIDVRAVEREAMAKGKDPVAAVNEAKRINAERQAALTAIRNQIKQQYKDDGAREKALARHLRSLDEEHAEATKAWEKANARTSAQVQKLERELAEEEIRRTESERKASIADAETAAKAQQKAIADQIKADKEAARVFQAKQREEARQKRENDPVKAYNAELRRRAAYVEAIRRGDDGYAAMLAPEADHEKMKAAIREIESAHPDSSDYRKKKNYLDALKAQPIPRRTETLP